MTPKTAVFLDLDGTLWEWGEVPQSAIDAIHAAQARGHKFLTNTGRSRSEVPDLAYLGLDGYCFAAGAEVILDGKHVVDRPLGETRVRALMELFNRLGLNYNVEGGDQSWIKINNQADFDEMFSFAPPDDPIASVDPVSMMPDEALGSVYKAFYHGGKPNFAEVAASMPEGVTLTELGPGIAEATSSDVTKATAMEAVRAYLGPGWRTMACGDSDNDLPMLRAADVSVCMGNGNDNAKAAATWVTTDIRDNGLANAFAHFGLLD